jgi:hypothetical protein
VQFRLTYDGELLGASRSDTRAKHKEQIRRIFSHQLKHLFKMSPRLRKMLVRETEWVGRNRRVTHFSDVEALGNKFRMGNLLCVPLATEALDLTCGLEILFLQPDYPGMSLVRSGDLDNRLKTIFDALRRPLNMEEICGGIPAEEVPVFCLLEDDKFITHLSVTTDLLLEPNSDANHVRLVIKVTLLPNAITDSNVHLAL